MPVGRFAAIVLISLAAWVPAMAERSVESAAGRRPLAHPDILQLPPKPSAQTLISPADTGIAAPAADAGSSATPSTSTSAAEKSLGSVVEQGKEILRHNDGKKSVVDTAQAKSVVGRNTGRFSVVSELWPLLAVLAVIGAAAMVIKKYMPSQKFAVGSDVLRIVARTPIGPKQQLMLVKLGRRLVLLGLSPERINALTTVEDADQVALLLGEAASGRPDSMAQAFATSMNQESAAYGVDVADVSDEDVTESTRGHVQGLLQKVRKMAGKGQ